MPLFFIPALFAIYKLAYRLGRLLGSGAAVAAGRGVLPYSRPASTTAWLGRCALSLAILAITSGVLSWLSPRMDTLPSLLGSWLALLLLPRPTPRLFLMIGRLFAMATSIAVLDSSWTWAIKHWPQIGSYDGVFLICWWGLAFTMLVWAFLALRKSSQTNSALVPVIQRPIGEYPQPVPRVLVAETSHKHLSVSAEWVTRFTRVNISAQVKTQKHVLSTQSDGR